MMWWLSLVACVGTDPEDSACEVIDTALDVACACGAPEVAVGGGADAFEATSDGAALTMVHGPQGGWHVLASARIANTDPIVSIHYTIDVASRGARISDNLLRVQIVEVDACTGDFPGMYGFLDVGALAEGEADTPPELIAGEELILQLEVEDLVGRTAIDTLTGVATLDAIDVD